jgi:hypothetical protein
VGLVLAASYLGPRVVIGAGEPAVAGLGHSRTVEAPVSMPSQSVPPEGGLSAPGSLKLVVRD